LEVDHALAAKRFESDQPQHGVALLAKGDLLGHRIKPGAADSTEPWLTIVGVVGDVRQNWWNPITRPVIYKPFAQSPQRSMTLLLRRRQIQPAMPSACAM